METHAERNKGSENLEKKSEDKPYLWVLLSPFPKPIWDFVCSTVNSALHFSCYSKRKHGKSQKWQETFKNGVLIYWPGQSTLLRACYHCEQVAALLSYRSLLMKEPTQDKALPSAVEFLGGLLYSLCLSFAELKHHLSSPRTLTETLSCTWLDKTCKNQHACEIWSE